MKKFRETKFGAILLRNFPLKILALAAAIILWIVITNIEDPVDTNYYSGIEVELTNTQLLTDNGYTYHIVKGKTVTIAVKGPKSVRDKVEKSDFKAIADVNDLSSNKEIKIQVTYVGSENFESRLELTASSTMTLAIENEVSREFTIQVDKDSLGNPESGYIIGDVSVSPTTIKVTGAESVVDEIDHVAVRYDVTNMNQSVTDTVVPVFYDAEGNELDATRFTCSRDSVRIDIVILPTKWVEVNYALSGTPAEGYEVDSDTPSVTSVQIAGTKENLAKIESIDIPAGGLDVTGLRSDTTLTVSLLTYLARDYTIISDTKNLSVAVTIKHMISRDIEIKYEDISIVGLSGNLLATLTNGAKLPSSDEGDAPENEERTNTQGSIVVTIYGEEQAVNALTVADLSPTVSATARVPGTYSVKIAMVTNDRYTIEDTYYITLIITAPVEEETTAEAKEPEKETTTSATTSASSATTPTTTASTTTAPTTTHSSEESSASEEETKKN